MRKPPKTDPTKSARLILSHARVLKGYVKQYNGLVIRSVKIAGGERQLESPIKPNMEPTLIASVTEIGNLVNQQAQPDLVEHATQSYRHGEAFAKTVLKLPKGQTVETGISFNLPISQETLNRLIASQKNEFAGMTADMNRAVTKEILNGVQAGESIPQMTKRITAVSEKIGYAQAERIARSETMDAVNAGTLDRYQMSGFDSVERLEAMDERTCTKPFTGAWSRFVGGCQALNGTVFKISDIPPGNPHPNCRGCWIPAIGKRTLSASPIPGQVWGSRITISSMQEPAGAKPGDVWIIPGEV